jgi:hypothetical protein
MAVVSHVLARIFRVLDLELIAAAVGLGRIDEPMDDIRSFHNRSSYSKRGEFTQIPPCRWPSAVLQFRSLFLVLEVQYLGGYSGQVRTVGDLRPSQLSCSSTNWI